MAPVLLIQRADFFRYPASSQLAWLDLKGRLAPGATACAAENELNVLFKSLDRQQQGRATTVVVSDGALNQRTGRGERPFRPHRLGAGHDSPHAAAGVYERRDTVARPRDGTPPRNRCPRVAGCYTRSAGATTPFGNAPARAPCGDGESDHRLVRVPRGRSDAHLGSNRRGVWRGRTPPAR
jgi:hypothetical protein